MSTPSIIDGVLIHRELLNLPSDWIVEDTAFLRFRYHRYSFPSTALRAGTYSRPVPLIEQLLGLRISILYIHTPAPVEESRDLPVDLDAPYFFRYWAAVGLFRATYTVVFRGDRKSLHPRQVEVLSKFCTGGFSAGEPILGCYGLWPGGLVDVEDLTHASREWRETVRAMKEIWIDYCTVNTFSAYFHVYRYDKLLNGDERWREVKSLYDV